LKKTGSQAIHYLKNNGITGRGSRNNMGENRKANKSVRIKIIWRDRWNGNCLAGVLSPRPAHVLCAARVSCL
jgi:hypothetical protein